MNADDTRVPVSGSTLRKIAAALSLLKQSPVALVGAGLILFWVLMAIFAPLVAPFDPVQQIKPFLPPGTIDGEGRLFLFGTDQLGRDVFSRVVHGSRTVLTYGVTATLSAYVVGSVAGVCAGYMRGWVDEILSFIANVILSFPVILLYIIIITTIGASGLNIVLAVTFASAPGIMRIVRGLTLDLATRDYVAAAHTRGEGALWVMFVEILPNARGPLIVDACLRLGYVAITIGVLGFLGLGLPPPTPDWGNMINETRSLAMSFPHMILFPCIAISSLVLGFNLLADGVREIMQRD